MGQLKSHLGLSLLGNVRVVGDFVLDLSQSSGSGVKGVIWTVPGSFM